MALPAHSAVWVLGVAIGCGRLGFDAGGAPGDEDAARDATTDATALAVTSGLVAWYPMDDLEVLDATQLRTVDATQTGHSATCDVGACPAVVTGLHGNAAQFDGMVTKLYTTGSPADLETTTGFTVSAWISMSTAPAARACVATKNLGTGTFNSWALCVEPSRQLLFFTVSGSTRRFLFSPATVPLGGWHHAAIRWDGSTKTLSLDGLDDASDTATIDFDGGTINIGAETEAGATFAPFGGMIDDLAVYSRALSAGEVAALAIP